MEREKIKKCPTCGTENDIYTRSCKQCGKRLEQAISPLSIKLSAFTKICPYCHYVNDIDARRCANPDCGKNLVDASLMEPGTFMQPLVNDQGPELSALVPAPVSTKFSQKSSFIKFHLTRREKLLFLTIFLLFVLVIVPLSLNFRHSASQSGSPGSTSSPIISLLPDGLGEVRVASNQYIGVNDGSYPPFDIGGITQSLKMQAAQQLQAGNPQAATALWNTALSQRSSDGETLIYLEDQRVLTSGKPYVTLVAATSFTSPFPDVQYESDLQGIYVAQHAFNQSVSSFELNILIANSASSISATNSALVAQQIVRIAAKDPHIVGVIGWLNSSNTLNAMKTFTDAKLPLISPQASSDYLTAISSYFFRVVSPNKIQAQTAAQFMKTTLGIKNPVVFVDRSDAYSQNLAQDFETQFASGGQLHEEVFKTDGTQQFSPLIQDALKYHPDAFYFTSVSSVDAAHFQDALPTSGPNAAIPALGGDGGYTVHKNAYGRWYFTAYAFHDESQSPIVKRFLQMYKDNFNPGPHPQKPDGYYGYSLPDDHAMLSYDATSVALQALKTAYMHGKTALTPDALKNELSNIKGQNAFQGVSGQIAFGPGNDPINKAIVILSLAKDGSFKLQAVGGGCFLKECS